MILSQKKRAKMKVLIYKPWAKEKYNFLEHHRRKIGFRTG